VARADDDGIVDGICHAGHKNDPWSKQQNALVEEGTERPLKKPLKNSLPVLYCF
jgi:hypothetical protein